MKIRMAQGKDAERIASYNSAMARETEGKSLKSDIIRSGVNAVLNDPSLGFYLILEINEFPAGQVLITTEWSDWRNNYFWWIQSVYVHPDYRKQGIYRALHEEIRKRAKTAGNVAGIRLYVDSDNIDAQNVYQKMGMVESNYRFFEEEWDRHA